MAEQAVVQFAVGSTPTCLDHRVTAATAEEAAQRLFLAQYRIGSPSTGILFVQRLRDLRVVGDIVEVRVAITVAATRSGVRSTKKRARSVQRFRAKRRRRGA